MAVDKNLKTEFLRLFRPHPHLSQTTLNSSGRLFKIGDADGIYHAL